MSDCGARLVRFFDGVLDDRVRGMPIANPRLRVEAVGFAAIGNDQLGVLIAPWFMNLVLVPGDDDFEHHASGDRQRVELPGETIDFQVARHAGVGTYLSTPLFHSVAEFPDQKTARRIALEILASLRRPPHAATRARGSTVVSRRRFLAGNGTG